MIVHLQAALVKLDSLCFCVVFISLLSHLCLAWRGLWSERDTAAEVPASGERDPGARSRGGFHSGELTARHSNAAKHNCPFAHRIGKGWYTLFIQPFILLSADTFNGLSQRECPPLCSSTTSSCIYSGECKRVKHFGGVIFMSTSYCCATYCT